MWFFTPPSNQFIRNLLLHKNNKKIKGHTIKSNLKIGIEALRLVGEKLHHQKTQMSTFTNIGYFKVMWGWGCVLVVCVVTKANNVYHSLQKIFIYAIDWLSGTIGGNGEVPDIILVTYSKVGIGKPKTSEPNPNLPIESVLTSASIGHRISQAYPCMIILQWLILLPRVVSQSQERQKKCYFKKLYL